MGKLICGLFRPPSVVILFTLCNPSCVEVIVEEFRFVDIPLSVEVIVVVWLYAYPSKCKGDCCSFDFVPYPSKCRGDLYLG